MAIHIKEVKADFEAKGADLILEAKGELESAGPFDLLPQDKEFSEVVGVLKITPHGSVVFSVAGKVIDKPKTGEGVQTAAPESPAGSTGEQASIPSENKEKKEEDQKDEKLEKVSQ